MRQTTPRELIDEIGVLLQNLRVSERDFIGKSGAKTKIHEAVIDAIAQKWQSEKGMYLDRYGERIDFIGREKDSRRGKIALAVEVDRWYDAHGSWTKLADIRAENKIWVYVTKDSKAEYFFERAGKEIKRFLGFRNENESTFGKFALMLKSPTLFKLEWIFPSERGITGKTIREPTRST